MNQILVPADDLITQQQAQISDLQAKIALTPKPWQTFSSLELMGDWQQPGNAGDDGGPSSGPAGKFTFGQFPVPKGATAVQWMAAKAYNNGYFYRREKRIVNPDSITKYQYTWMWGFDTQGNLSACQANEWEVQHVSSDGWLYNLAGQNSLIFPSLTFRYFTYTDSPNTSSWNLPKNQVPIKPVAGKMITSTLVGHRDPVAHTITHDAVIIDGTTFPLGITQPAMKAPANYEPGINHAFQWDSDAKATPYTGLLAGIRLDVQ